MTPSSDEAEESSRHGMTPGKQSRDAFMTLETLERQRPSSIDDNCKTYL